VYHRRDVFGRGVICGQSWHPKQVTARKLSNVTCPACIAKGKAFQKSAKARVAGLL
jgi:hypothetical protein